MGIGRAKNMRVQPVSERQVIDKASTTGEQAMVL